MSDQTITASRAAILSDMHRLAEEVKALAQRIPDNAKFSDAVAKCSVMGAFDKLMDAQNSYRGEDP